MSGLPSGWVEARFVDCAVIKLGKMLDDAKNVGEPTAYLRNINVRWGSFDLLDLAEMRMSMAERTALAVQDGDLLVCEGGEPGRSAVWNRGSTNLTFQKALMRVRPRQDVDARFLAALLRHLSLTSRLSRYFTGTTIKHLPQAALSSVPVPLPPAPEQRRIVAKIDRLSARSKRARDELNSANKMLTQYKKHLLISIFVPLIEEYESVIMNNACDVVQSGGTPKGGFVLQGIPFLKVYNIVHNKIEFDGKPQFISPKTQISECRKSICKTGDVLMNIVGPPLGKIALVPIEFGDCNINQAICLFRCSASLHNYFLYFFLLSGISIESILRETRGIVGQVNISLSQCRAFSIPLPPLLQQHEIVRSIEHSFAAVDRLAAEARSARALLDTLDQAILAKAFRGELVPQDPNDEPAGVLLERIRIERAAAPPKPRGRRRAEAT